MQPFLRFAFIQYQERSGEEDRKPGGKTLVRYGTCGGRIGQEKVEDRFITTPVIPDDGKIPRRSISSEHSSN